jgi:hypothetical protein
MKLPLLILALWLTAYSISAQQGEALTSQTPTSQAPTLTLEEKQILTLDLKAEQDFRAAAVRLPEYQAWQGGRAVLEILLKAKHLTVEQARKLANVK